MAATRVAVQFNLAPHPASPPADPAFKVWVNVEHSAAFSATATTNIWFGIGAPATRFVMPEPVEQLRTENLWESTCLEIFLRVPGADAYREWNFAPSTAWAAYDFTNNRDGRTEPDVAAPYIRVEDNLTWWALGATISMDAKSVFEVGLSAVLEEKEGTKSYWALAHPDGEKPDFHDPACFTAHLP